MRCPNCENIIIQKPEPIHYWFCNKCNEIIEIIIEDEEEAE